MSIEATKYSQDWTNHPAYQALVAPDAEWAFVYTEGAQESVARCRLVGGAPVYETQPITEGREAYGEVLPLDADKAVCLRGLHDKLLLARNIVSEFVENCPTRFKERNAALVCYSGLGRHVASSAAEAEYYRMQRLAIHTSGELVLTIIAPLPSDTSSAEREWIYGHTGTYVITKGAVDLKHAAGRVVNDLNSKKRPTCGMHYMHHTTMVDNYFLPAVRRMAQLTSSS